MGVFGVFAGMFVNDNHVLMRGVGWSMLFTGPVCAVISAITASICLATGMSFETRISICVGLCLFRLCRHVVMLTYPASLVLSPSGTADISCVSLSLCQVRIAPCFPFCSFSLPLPAALEISPCSPFCALLLLLSGFPYEKDSLSIGIEQAINPSNND